MYYFRLDWTYVLCIIGMLLSLAASAAVNRTFSKYNRVKNRIGLTGAQAAQRVLKAGGITDVKIEHISGKLTDNYDPRSKTLRLSDSTYASSSVAAVCVAAHECGHAVQHKEQYRPLVLRSTLVPASNFGSRLFWPLFIIGLILSFEPLMLIGVILFCLAVIFQLITLPVEFNASSRALKILRSTGMLDEQELKGGRRVLQAAAMTYVAGLASSILQLLRLLLLSNRRSRR